MQLLNRRKFLEIAGMSAAGLLTRSSRASLPDSYIQSSKIDNLPNIVIIFVDDLGYADLGCQGSADLKTPSIDSLAETGVRFTNGYVTAPVCSPSRAGLITGRYQQRFGHEFNPGSEQHASPEFGLPLSETTLAQLLKNRGYATGYIGKWHLGYQPEHHPQERGFDEFFGFLGGGHTYFPWLSEHSSIMRGTEPVEENTYLTDAFTREAVTYIQNHHQHPFFLYLSYNAVHAPLQAILKYVNRFPGIEDTDRRKFAAMMAAVDDGVGAILENLRELDIEENTLIFLLSDNGGPTPETTSKNDPLRGFKGSVYEGGIRIPFLVHWKGHIPSGQIIDHPVSSLDILPTAISAAEGSSYQDEAVDGADLLPLLSGETSEPPHETLFWRYGYRLAVRNQQWKLLYNHSVEPELYNLDTDIGETTNLVAEQPDIVDLLRTALQQWNEELIDPL